MRIHTFDKLYREGKYSPKMFSIGLHPRLIGRPGRSIALEKIVKLSPSKKDDVIFDAVLKPVWEAVTKGKTK